MSTSRKHFPRTERIYDHMLAQMVHTTTSEMLVGVSRIVETHLRGRRISFCDAMGSATLDVQHRMGGDYHIGADEFWSRPRAGGRSRDNYYRARQLPWVKELQELLKEYDAVSRNMYAVEVVIRERDFT